MRAFSEQRSFLPTLVVERPPSSEGSFLPTLLPRRGRPFPPPLLSCQERARVLEVR